MDKLAQLGTASISKEHQKTHSYILPGEEFQVCFVKYRTFAWGERKRGNGHREGEDGLPSLHVAEGNDDSGGNC